MLKTRLINGLRTGMDHMIPCSLLVSIALFYTMTNTLVWDAPGDVLAASASALCGWKGVNSLSLSLSLSQPCVAGQV